MKYRHPIIIAAVLAATTLYGCSPTEQSADTRDVERVQAQQAQYEKAQPVPVYDWSVERDLVIKLYNVRNQKVSTHSVWRSDRGMIEGDCPSYGYGIPYDTSLTNPLAPMINTYDAIGAGWGQSSHTVEQAEPNGIFASKNTSATWVLCLGASGSIEPVYVETKVTVYPGPVKVDYETNRVTRSGAANVLIPKN